MSVFFYGPVPPRSRTRFMRAARVLGRRFSRPRRLLSARGRPAAPRSLRPHFGGERRRSPRARVVMYCSMEREREGERDIYAYIYIYSVYLQ